MKELLRDVLLDLLLRLFQTTISAYKGLLGRFLLSLNLALFKKELVYYHLRVSRDASRRTLRYSPMLTDSLDPLQDRPC